MHYPARVSSHAPSHEGRPSALQTWRYILRYLIAGALIAGTITVGVTAAAFSATHDAETATGLMQSDPVDVRAAFDVVAPARMFSGRRQSKTILPTNDPLHSRFGETEEDALAKAFNGAETRPPEGPEAAPTNTCQSAPCLVASLSRPRSDRKRQLSPHLKAYAYFLARRAMARSEPMEPVAQKILLRYPSLWVRAFEREVIAAGGQPTDAAPAMLANLTAELDSAAHAAMVFAGYGALVTLMLGTACIIWWRYRRPEDSLVTT
ncbi:MAG: hypothetical protein ACI9OJ_005793 [Myxococcota bacterium]